MLSKSGASIVLIKKIIDCIALPSYPKASTDGILYLVPTINQAYIYNKEDARKLIENQMSIVGSNILNMLYIC